ncbi:MAG: hypothetical protein WCA77_05995 [Thermoplasmata archaeon]
MPSDTRCKKCPHELSHHIEMPSAVWRYCRECHQFCEIDPLDFRQFLK